MPVPRNMKASLTMSSLDHEPETARSSSSAAKPRKRRAPVVTELPSTIAEWYEAVKRHGVENTTLEEAIVAQATKLAVPTPPRPARRPRRARSRTRRSLSRPRISISNAFSSSARCRDRGRVGRASRVFGSRRQASSPWRIFELPRFS